MGNIYNLTTKSSECFIELYSSWIVNLLKIILVQATEHFNMAVKQLVNSRGQQFYSLLKFNFQNLKNLKSLYWEFLLKGLFKIPFQNCWLTYNFNTTSTSKSALTHKNKHLNKRQLFYLKESNFLFLIPKW